MANFSKYLGKDERVLNSIDMKDETVWAQNNIAAAEYKSWTTLIVTNKRMFSVNKRKLNMREFRLEDIVSTGWIYRPQWGKIISGIIFLIVSALIFISSRTVANALADLSAEIGVAANASSIAAGINFIAIIVGVIAIMILLTYFLLKRTTLTLTTKDGREYMFLLRGRRGHVDEFRMTVQDAKDLYFEETENRYFDKMRSVLFDQSNYEYALNNSKQTLKESEQPKLEKEEYMLWERKNAQISESENRRLSESETKMLEEATMRLNADGTLQLNSAGAYQLTANNAYLLENGGDSDGENTSIKSSEKSASGSLVDKASDLFEQMEFEVSKLDMPDADLLLLKDGLRYIVVADGDDSKIITMELIEKTIRSKDRYKTDFGIFISAGDLPEDVQEYANRNKVKIIYVKAE